MAEYQNYAVVNPVADAVEKNWCISAKLLSSVQQATVEFASGKSYNYASRYPVAEGDVAVIGKTLPDLTGDRIEPSATTGSFGVVSEALPKLEIKRSHASELDFVFTTNVAKKQITDCAKYLDMDGNEKTLQYGKKTQSFYPITFLIRKLLAAASIIAYPKFAGDANVEKAVAYIAQPQIITKTMAALEWAVPYSRADICLDDIHIAIAEKNIAELQAMGLSYMKDGALIGDDRGNDIPDIVNAYVNKYAYIGAVSIMVRGGFANLLKAFLSANPPVASFHDEMLEDIGSNAVPEALNILKEYAPQ